MTTTAFPRETLLIPQSRATETTRSFALAFAFSLLIALCARFTIYLPFTPIPITGQMLPVLLAGALLGSRWGAAAVGIYLLEGAAGAPVFQGGMAGFGYLLATPTIGFLAGFPVGAWLTGALCEHGWDRTVLRAVGAMGLGMLAVYGVGWLGMLRFMSPSDALVKGLLPFVLVDAFKIAVAAALLPLGWKLTRRN